MILRPPLDEDVPAIIELMNAASLAAFGTADTTEAELRRWLTSPDVDPVRDLRLAEQDGLVVGYADVDPTGTDPVRNWCDICVHPAAQVEAVATALVSWAEERSAEGLLRVWVPSVATDLKRSYEQLGLQLVRHSFRMQIDLGAEPEAATWPEGIEVRMFRKGDEQVVYEAHQETFEDSWEHVREPYEEWAHWLVERDDFDPSLWFLAHDGDELAGILLSVPMETEPDAGYVQILGVRRRWRRRGLGLALLRHAFREFHHRGFARVTLGVDATSLTGANRLYASAGMRVVRQFDFYEKAL